MAADPSLSDFPVSKTLAITAARDQLTHLPEEFEARSITSVAVTRRGTPVMAILSWELYESLMETLEIMGDPQAMSDLRQSIAEIRDGAPSFTIDDLRRELEP
jgi:antitoxin YefM